MSEQKHGRPTPPGTAPQPMRRATKHKRPQFGALLQAQHAARQKRRLQSELDVRKSDGMPRIAR